MQRLFNIFCVFVFLAFLVGCGSGKVPLGGKVTFSDTGEPLTKGTVAFLKGGEISRGTIQSDGTYTIGTERETDGLPPGNYQVYISGSEKTISIDAEKGNDYEPQIAPKYENPDTSGLTVEVDAKTKTFNIEVERVAPAGRR